MTNLQKEQIRGVNVILKALAVHHNGLDAAIAHLASAAANDRRRSVIWAVQSLRILRGKQEGPCGSAVSIFSSAVSELIVQLLLI